MLYHVSFDARYVFLLQLTDTLIQQEFGDSSWIFGESVSALQAWLGLELPFSRSCCLYASLHIAGQLAYVILLFQPGQACTLRADDCLHDVMESSPLDIELVT